LSVLTEETHPLHWAQVDCYAFMYAKQEQLEELWVQLTYYHLESKELRRFVKKRTLAELESFFQSLVQPYLQWKQKHWTWLKQRNASIQKIAFPFSEYREGQRKLMVAVYQTLVKKKKLFVQAPTGIGKTLACLFPAIKTVGEGRFDKIFYLTAKTIARSVAEKALEQLREAGLAYKSVTLIAKDKICFNSPCIVQECEFAKGYFDRLPQALAGLWLEDVFDQKTLEKYAREFSICPFEFSLEVALWVDIVLCDYNYVFDPRVYLRRFFQESSESYALLIDEAHNLVDRARQMFSATLEKDNILQVKKQMAGRELRLSKSLHRVNLAFLLLKKKLEKAGGSFYEKEAPQELYPALQHFVETAEALFERESFTIFPETLIELYFQAIHFLKTSELYDRHYVTSYEKKGNSFNIKLFCVDPSFLLKKAMKRGKSTVCFSATLTPLTYFKNLLGGEKEDFQLLLPSAFPPENLALMIHTSIETVYQKREQSYPPIAQVIQEMVRSKAGNYLVFFPSYAYLHSVVAVLQETPQGDIQYLIQTQEMTEIERAQFLSAFETLPQKGAKTLVGMVVLGGLFSEAIDLEGERLIGVLIVGVGLPQLCLERDILKEYFQEQNGQGFDYAYRYPGMQKVLQAAGRVIRSKTDRGIVVLLDRRFLENSYQSLFPSHWNSYTPLSSFTPFSPALELFWKSS
jgi:DNA excision repair protein ERCC-2